LWLENLLKEENSYFFTWQNLVRFYIIYIGVAKWTF
jgi:hypothetical protein